MTVGDAGGDVSANLGFANIRRTGNDSDLAACDAPFPMEQTKAGLRFKEPKSKHGRRKISLPPRAVADLADHRGDLLRHPDALVFCNSDGSPIKRNNLSVMWNREIRRIKGVPNVTFHALRHTHASALIKGGIDVVSVSRRLGHSSPVITLKVYAHLFGDGADTDAAIAIERMMG